MTEESIFRAILRQRGIENVRAYLHPDYGSLHDPFLLPDMHKAVARIKKAKNQQELIGIYGDYDLDGMAAATLLHDGLESLGMASEIFIPDRFIDGYGLAQRGIDYFKDRGIKLVITVDCGSRSAAEISYAASVGIDMVVTDHHEIDDWSEYAVAVINPRRSDSRYPTRSLAGVGVAFKLLCALQQKLTGLPKGQEKWLLDLVALGTIADIVELTQENRVLAHWGIKVLAKTRRIGLRQLLKDKGPERSVDEGLIGYYLAPRLNAAGRLQGAQAALDLLMSKDQQQAMRSAALLEKLNAQRRADQDRIVEQAMSQASQAADKAVLILVDKDWSHGINGIVASKLSEELHKPVFVLQDLGDGTLKGSGRSPVGFDLSEALDAVKPLLISGGGHQFAAGMTLLATNLTKIDAELQKFFQKSQKHHTPPEQIAEYDFQSTNLAGLSNRLVEMIDTMRPFGPGNEQPVFLLTDLRIIGSRAVGSGGDHLKGSVSDKIGIHLPFIGFKLGRIALPPADQLVSFVCHIEENNFRNSLQTELKLIRIIS